MLSFEWDIEKAKGNERKHDVTFDEASTVFADPLYAVNERSYYESNAV